MGNRRDQERVKMRCKLVAKHWDEMMENLDQVISEGGNGCKEIYKRLSLMTPILQKSIIKEFNHK